MRRFSLIAALLFCAACGGAVHGDLGITREDGNCETPIAVADVAETGDDGETIVRDTTAGAPFDHDGSCSQYSAREIVYAWEAPEAGTVVVTMEGGDGDEDHPDPLLYVSTTCDDETEVACNDDEETGDMLNSRVTFGVTAGTTYFIFADGYQRGDEGSFVLTIAYEG